MASAQSTKTVTATSSRRKATTSGKYTPFMSLWAYHSADACLAVFDAL